MPPAQVWATAIADTGAKLLLVIAIGAQLFCGMSSITANSPSGQVNRDLDRYSMTCIATVEGARGLACPGPRRLG